MKVMKLGTNAKAFATVENKIIKDSHSQDCLAAEDLPKDKLDELMGKLKGKTVKAVLAGSNKKALYQLFNASVKCISGAEPDQKYKKTCFIGASAGCLKRMGMKSMLGALKACKMCPNDLVME